MASVRTIAKRAAAKRRAAETRAKGLMLTRSEVRFQIDVTATRHRLRRRGGRRTAAAAPIEGDGRLTNEQMSPAQRADVAGLFAATRQALDTRIIRLEVQIEGLPAGGDRLLLLQELNQLRLERQGLNEAEEAFIAAGSVTTIRPPTEAEVARARELADGLGEAIRAQETAERIAALADRLAALGRGLLDT